MIMSLATRVIGQTLQIKHRSRNRIDIQKKEEVMIKRRHIGIYLILAMLGGGLLFSSCNKEEVISQSQKETEKSDIIKFGINLSELWTPDIIGGPAGENSQATEGASANASPAASGTKSTEPLLLDCKDGNGPATKVYMYMIEEDMPEVVDTVATKADDTYVYGVYAYQVPIASVDVNASPLVYVPTASNINLFMNNLGLTSDGQNYDGGDKYWPGAAWYMQFYVYKPYIASADTYISISNSNNQPKITYTVPQDAALQKDIMSGASEFRNCSVTSAVSISLTHLLSHISVKAGDLAEGRIKSITLKNIYNKGERSLESGSWTLLPSGTPSKVDYTQFTPNLSDGDPTNDGAVSDLKGEDIQTMNLMPQTLSDEATIELVIEVTSDDPTATGSTRKHEYTLTKNLKEFTTTWAPNKKYTYIISTPEEIEVEVADVVTTDGSGNPVKQNLVIKNSGMSRIYVRASVVGYWVTPKGTDPNNPSDDDIIVADWQTTTEDDKTPDGTFNWNGGSGPELPDVGHGNWIKIDNYYYYKLPLESGAKIDGDNQLFTSYTLTANPPIPGSVFDMSIIVQAVYHSDVELAWPVTKDSSGELAKKIATP